MKTIMVGAFLAAVGGPDWVGGEAMYVLKPCNSLVVPQGVPVATPPRKQSGQDMVKDKCRGVVLAFSGPPGLNEGH